ncbi:MAG: NTP transferase domain-containing protein [Calditrichaeota bacterium]|nr:NTP transferase domain-containing protein [Calditrichota bacterium]
MKAVIPVAGHGRRLRPHTLVRPKVLLPLAGKPILGYIIEKLLADGIDELVFIVGHLREQIQDYVRQTFQVKAHFIHQEEKLGLAHAVFMAREVIQPEESFVIVLGDTIYDVDLRSIFESEFTALGVKEVDDPRRFGVAVLDEFGFVKKVVEKPQRLISKLALVGIYFIRKAERLFLALQQVMDRHIMLNEEYQLADGLQLMIDQGEKIIVFNVEGWYDCGEKKTLLETHRTILEKNHPRAEGEFAHSSIIEPVFIHPDATVEYSVIGPYVSIDKHCHIRNAVIRDTIIDHDTEIQNIVLSHSIIGHHVRLCGTAQNINVSDHSEIENIK